MTKNLFKVEIRTDCKMCGNPLPNSRYRTYCSKKCRDKRNSDKQTASGYSREWQRAKRERLKLAREKNENT